jgi:hypothetical protein
MDNTQNNTFRVFFSWQSDRIEVKKAIHRELDVVAKKLYKEGVNLIVDHDTRDRVGTQDINAEVLQKILHCDIFIADVTPVSKILSDTPKPVKLIPNPNVMYESGYALAHKGLSKMIFLASLQHGETIAQLPFDINHNTITSIHDLGQLPALSSMIRKIIDIVRNERMSIKNAYDCNVCFCLDDQFTDNITLIPQYQKVIYLSSTPSRRTNSLAKSAAVMSNFEAILRFAENVQKTGRLLAPSELATARVYTGEIDHSICTFQMAVGNIGECALENMYLLLELDDSGATFVENDRKMFVLDIPPSTNYHIMSACKIQSRIDLLNPNMFRNISTIYLKIPVGVENVTLHWFVQSTTHNQSGKLMINVKPEYIIESKEDDSKFGQTKILPYVEKIWRD